MSKSNLGLITVNRLYCGSGQMTNRTCAGLIVLRLGEAKEDLITRLLGPYLQAENVMTGLFANCDGSFTLRVLLIVPLENQIAFDGFQIYDFCCPEPAVQPIAYVVNSQARFAPMDLSNFLDARQQSGLSVIGFDSDDAPAEQSGLLCEWQVDSGPIIGDHDQFQRVLVDRIGLPDIPDVRIIAQVQ